MDPVSTRSRRLTALSALSTAVIGAVIGLGLAPAAGPPVGPNSMPAAHPGNSVPPITFAPEGSFPVLSPEQAQSDDLAPGTYRIRLAHQADWPDRCLDTMTVYSHPNDGEPMPTAPLGTVPPSDFSWEARAIDELDEVRRLREPICEPFRFADPPGAID